MVQEEKKTRKKQMQDNLKRFQSRLGLFKRRISKEEFTLLAIEVLCLEGDQGIHVVYSKFNDEFRRYFKRADPVVEINKLEKACKITKVNGRGGPCIFSPDNPPKRIGKRGRDAKAKKAMERESEKLPENGDLPDIMNLTDVAKALGWSQGKVGTIFHRNESEIPHRVVGSQVLVTEHALSLFKKFEKGPSKAKLFKDLEELRERLAKLEAIANQ